MPQLDHLTYFSQYFWLCIVFFAFYGACVKYYLPGLSRLTKYRAKTQNQEDLSITGSSSEVLDLKARLSLPPVMENLLGASSDYSRFSESLKWSSVMIWWLRPTLVTLTKDVSGHEVAAASKSVA